MKFDTKEIEMGKGKERLDTLLFEKGLFTSREKARKSIMAGIVFVNDKLSDKAGELVSIESKIEIRGETLPYVSRGGLKLEKALKVFNIEVYGKTAVDAGASTGGFTDCLLKNGASRVISIDVGYGQFAWELRIDPRVKLLERTNIRYVTPDIIDGLVDIGVIDVSFISLRLVLPAVKKLVKSNGDIVCLIKPQFEAGKEKVGKKGVVRDIDTHMDVVRSIIGFCIDNNFSISGLSYSPVKGPEGNIEYLLYLKNIPSEKIISDFDTLITSIVKGSHESII